MFKQTEPPLNFVNAEISDVVRSVLGDSLNRQFVIDPQVQGTVTFQSSNPIAEEAVLPALETILSVHNVALVNNNGVFNVLPTTEARRSGAQLRFNNRAGVGEPGFALQIVPLKFVTAQEMRDLLEPLAPPESIVRVDQNRNFLILAGTKNEIDTLVNTIDVFDVDMLEGMSFALFRVEQVEVNTLAQEIQDIFRSANAPIAELVELMPIPRLSSILVVSPQPDYLRQVQQWITRLDRREVGAGRKIYFYELQNAKAEDIAETLNSVLGFESTNTAEDTAAPLVDANGEQRFSQSDTSLLGGGEARVVAEPQRNALIILANAAEYDLIESVILQMDSAPEQVFIEGIVAEVVLTDALKYGVQWAFNDGNNSWTLSDIASGAVASQFPGFAYAYVVPDKQIALNALSSITDVNIISSPKIMTLNNETAVLQVGDQVPVATQSAVSVVDPGAPIVNSLQFRDTGVILEVTPRINKSGVVIIEITQEVSSVAETTTSGIDSPTIQQAKITSTIAVQDGQTIAIGGVIRETQSKSKSGVPGLSRVPILGIPFRSTDKNARRSELLIFLTPRIVRNMDDVQALNDYLRTEMPNIANMREEMSYVNRLRDTSMKLKGMSR